MAGGRIFINYRRDDTRADAGRLYDRLSMRFPRMVFRDVGSLEPGVEWHEAIRRILSASDACVVVIGPNWLTLTDPTGRCRLDDPRDTVRFEILTALNRRMRIFPVLVGGAKMPSEEALPPDLSPLCGYHALEITEQDWNEDIAKLVRALEVALRVAPEQEKPPKAELTARFSLFRGRFVLAFAATLGVALMVVGVAVHNKGGALNPTGSTSAENRANLPSEAAPTQSGQAQPAISSPAKEGSTAADQRETPKSPVLAEQSHDSEVGAQSGGGESRAEIGASDVVGNWQVKVSAPYRPMLYQEVALESNSRYQITLQGVNVAYGFWRYTPTTRTLELDGTNLLNYGAKMHCTLTAQGSGAERFSGRCSDSTGLSWTDELNRSARGGGSAEEIPGLDLSTLSNTERAAFARQLAGEACTCGCGRDLLACRHDEVEQCAYSLATARTRLAQFVASAPR